MRRAITLLFVIALGVDAKTLRVDSPLETWKGRRAVHAAGDALLILKDSDFHNGTIEADIAGSPQTGASEGTRGFVGIAFRVKDADHYECFYIRPTNGPVMGSGLRISVFSTRSRKSSSRRKNRKSKT